MANNLPADFWDKEQRHLLAALGPTLEAAAQSGARRSLSGLGVNYKLSDADASAWARSYTDQLLQQLGTTSQKLVGSALDEYFSTPGATMGDLVSTLTPKLAGNMARANAIAVTEVTRAYSAGQRTAYTRAGVKHWTWGTTNDELVCPVCGPLNGKTVEIGQPFGVDAEGQEITAPPAHPNCRCFVRPHVEVGERPDGNQPEPQPGTNASALAAPDLSTAQGIVDHFNKKYDVLVDHSPGYSMTPVEAQAPERLVKDNPRFSELALSDTNHPVHPDAMGVQHGDRVTIFAQGRQVDGPSEFTVNGTALTETLLHEIGESQWKQMSKVEQSNWTQLVDKYGIEREKNDGPSELFARWFSRVQVKDPDIPPEIQSWVQSLLSK